MSFGFGVGDFLDVYDKTKAIIDACRNGPPEFRELSCEVSTLQLAVKQVAEDAKNSNSLLCRKGKARLKDLEQIRLNCQEALDGVQAFVNKHSTLETSHDDKGVGSIVKRTWHAYQVGSDDLDTMRGKLTFYTSTIDLFLTSLQGVSLRRIEKMVYEIWSKQIADPQKSAASIASVHSITSLATGEPDKNAWDLLRAELLAVGVSSSGIEDHKADIIAYLRGLIADGLSISDVVADNESRMATDTEWQQGGHTTPDFTLPYVNRRFRTKVNNVFITDDTEWRQGGRTTPAFTLPYVNRLFRTQVNNVFITGTSSVVTQK